MTWIRCGKENRAFNLELFEEVRVDGNAVLMIRDECIQVLRFDSDQDALENFDRLLAAIKRGDSLKIL